MSDPERDIDAIATWDRDEGSSARRTGRRHETARCFICGREIEHESRFGDVTCGAVKCREQMARLQR